MAAKYGEDHYGWNCRLSKGDTVVVFGRAFAKGKTLFSGMSDLRSTMVSMLASGMICDVTGSLLQAIF